MISPRIYQTTQHHIPESSIPHNCCFEEFKVQNLDTLHIIIELLKKKQCLIWEQMELRRILYMVHIRLLDCSTWGFLLQVKLFESIKPLFVNKVRMPRSNNG